MRKALYDVLRLLRPRQWIKNVAIYAAIVFSGQLFEADLFWKVTVGFFVFCGLSSAIYVVNDIFDVKKDRLHPFKKNRPIANKSVSIPSGWMLAIALGLLSIVVSLSVSPAFFIMCLVYLVLQVSYSLVLKHIAVIDILAIAAGYILRVYAGEFVSGFHISVWLLLTTISISLFLAIGKRRSELTLVSRMAEGHMDATRKSLSHYSERLLDVYASMFATSTFISYALFTFLENPVRFHLPFNFLLPEFFPAFFQRKWLMITIIPVVYGMMRYMQDIYEKHEGESPERVLLSDKPLLATVIIWALLVIGIIYFIGT